MKELSTTFLCDEEISVHGVRYRRVRKGEWIVISDNEYSTVYSCPFCNGTYYISHMYPTINMDFTKIATKEPLPNFCRNCGTDMRKERI